MTDLIERLRGWHGAKLLGGEILRDTKDAANEIERLRAALVQFVAVCDTAPPTSLITELGIACAVARARLQFPLGAGPLQVDAEEDLK